MFILFNCCPHVGASQRSDSSAQCSPGAFKPKSSAPTPLRRSIMWCPRAFVLLVASCFVLLPVTTGESTQDCLAWGFSSPSCADCDTLASFVPKDEELVEQCKVCCVRDAALVIYSSATLVVPGQLGMWPEIKNFIDKKAPDYKGRLKVSQVWNAQPSLKLKHEGGTETLRVENWKVAQFEEFLKERVQPATARAA